MSYPLTLSRSEELAVVERNGWVESRHAGAAVVVGRDGNIIAELGDSRASIFPRSTLKPFQTLASMRAGVPLRGAHVALASASHVGSFEHQRAALEMLHLANLDESALQCPTAWPKHAETRLEISRTTGEPNRLAFNCSGKHAAFLMACVENGWPIENYLDPKHPLQQAVLETVEEFTESPLANIAVDGCGAPVPAIELVGLARATSKLAAAPGDKSSDARAATIATAMLDYPWAVQGHGEENTVVMEELEVISKLGAEGVLILGAPDGTACAIKMLDGNGRAATLVGLTLLANAGAISVEKVQEVLPKVVPPVLGGGQPHGKIRLARPVMDLLED
ncbi:asparaginase [Neomicrococcus lactis]|uniref:L-asparaginase II n=1 Tax=Neomicrococcus lactis TaxID=732241 RepID=A0A7W8YCZ6_9MICC|nr:asparaginase [Neomicrococcus lactis]MBB5599295.1 L-asparaginase II [Neomicrococcus lactis]